MVATFVGSVDSSARGHGVSGGGFGKRSLEGTRKADGRAALVFCHGLKVHKFNILSYTPFSY